MRLEHDIVDMDKIIAYWIKDYQLKEGESLHNHEFYYDPHKGKVVFRLFVNETGGNE